MLQQTTLFLLLEEYDAVTAAKTPQSVAPSAVQTSAVSSDAAKQNMIPVTIGGYSVIGKLTIEMISQTLPVISETDGKALKVSVCWYQGAMPGEKGNMVITGHDYANGAHFGRLSELETGDTVTFTTPDKDYVYTVYDKEVIRPDQPEKLDEYEGDMALTLLTCTNHGNSRLVVRCKLG